TLGPKQASFLVQSAIRGHIAYDHTAHPAITDQNVGAQSQYEVRNVQGAGTLHCAAELVVGFGFEKKIGGSADPEGGKRLQENIPAHPPRSHLRHEVPDGAA